MTEPVETMPGFWPIQKIKTLEHDGMVKRKVCATTPPQVEYALTALGRSLSEPVRQLAKWARAHIATIHDNRLRYDASG